ncbi:rhodanese-like domain-containing protein [Colletotrichum limetticola]|uniref:Rhodanese-like domain-containing protein n=1 Tax=Colletotrichum limetticola TaxID=1209924 RepID=A0ABQ9Q609_9PEZI|nr:rhodanese-like domain-containing protein [Colletotrichum limetticola]
MASTRSVCANALRASSQLARAPTAAATTRRSFAAAATSTLSARAVPGKTTTPLRSRAAAAVTTNPHEKERVEDDYHQISANGSKIWDFEQMAELAKDPGNVVIVVVPFRLTKPTLSTTDAREPHELVETGRIPTALNIPVATAPESFLIADEDFEDRYGYPRPSKDTELVFYCKAGVRSRALATLARDAGWSKVGEYPGSWLDWTKKGGEVEKGGKQIGQD